MKKIPVTVLTGYLGSGKTSLLNHILHGNHGKKIAVIVNDMGEVNIDEFLIDKKGFKRTEEKLVSMSNGCICCTLREDLIVELDQLSRIADIDQIIIEASGISEPIPIVQSIILAENPLNLDLTNRLMVDAIITVVDMKRFWDNFGTGENIQARKAEANVREDERDIRDLLIDQIEYCNILLLNKCDLIDEESLDKINRLVAKIQPNAKIIRSIKGKVDLTQILDTKSFNMDEISYSAGWLKELELGYQSHIPETEEYGISSFVYRNRLPFDAKKFTYFVDEKFPENVTRTKGFVWFAQHSDFSAIFETAGSYKSIEVLTYWVDTLPKTERQLIISQNPELKEGWHPLFGDRINELVFIGMDMDQEWIEQQLDSCLISEDDLTRSDYSNNSPFPWEKSILSTKTEPTKKIVKENGLKTD